jgi:hypothetical protein
LNDSNGKPDVMTTDEQLFDIARDALAANKRVMVSIRGLHATPVLGITVSPDARHVTLACPASVELGTPASHVTLRAEDVLGVSVLD